MASIFTRTLTRSAAVAGALGLAVALGAPAAQAQAGSADLGSLLGILDLEAAAGSLAGSLSGEGGADAGSAGSIVPLLTSDSVTAALETAQGSTGSIGELSGSLNPDTAGETIVGSIQSLSAEDGGAAGSLGEIPAESIESLFGTIGQASVSPAQ